MISSISKTLIALTASKKCLKIINRPRHSLFIFIFLLHILSISVSNCTCSLTVRTIDQRDKVLLDRLELKACHTICDVTDESHTRRESHAGFALQYNSEQKGARGGDLSVSVDRFVSSYVLFFFPPEVT